MGTRPQNPCQEDDDDDLHSGRAATISGQSVSMSGSIGSPSSRSEQTMATPVSDNTFLRLNHIDINGDDAGSLDAISNKKKKRRQRAVGGDKSGRGLLQLSMKGSSTAQHCGRQAGNALCQNRLCCSQFRWCGSTIEYCGRGCQSQCPGSNPTPTPNPSANGDDVGSIITEALFNQMLPYRNDPRCPSNGFYTYSAFIAAARSFSGFGTTGDLNTRKRELAAFFGQTSHETTGGWATAPDGPYAWGYCFIRETGNPGAYCSSTAWPCPAGREYFGRGPIQLTHNYNYGLAGQSLGLDLINNPDQVATNAVTSFRTAIWFWMTPQGNKPSSHNVIIGQWTPSAADRAAGRFPGYGAITNIINGGLECGIEQDSRVVSRIGFYRRYCDLLGVSYGSNLDCYNQKPF